MRIISGVLLAAMAAALHGPAGAQDQPGTTDLESALTADLPPYWQVNEVEIQASVNDGDAVSPQFRQRFTATVAPREDLYRRVEEVEPFRVVATATPSGTSHRLYGIGHSTLKSGRWAVRLEMESSVAALGKPRSLFEGPVVVPGDPASQQVFEMFMQGRETAKAMAERAARTAVNADVLARLDAEAQAQEQALLEDSYRRRLEALKGRIDADLAGVSAAVDTMLADNRTVLAKLEALHEQKVAAVTARAETQLAIAEANQEAVAQDELAAALEALAEKRKRVADLNARAVEARMAADKSRYAQVRAGLAVSDDASEQLAAFDAAMSSDIASLQRLALSLAFRSGNDELQGAALAAYVAGLPQMSIAVAYKDGENKDKTYVQSLQLTEVNGSNFAGELSTPGWSDFAKASGTIQGDSLSLRAPWSSRNGCAWAARVDEKGALTGPMQCSANGGISRNNPGGVGSVAF